MTNDLINGSFEFIGAAMYVLTIRRLLRDKKYRGVSPWPVAFFSSWGAWNLIYYPSLGQWFSFAGGVALVLVNCVQLYLMWRYRKN